MAYGGELFATEAALQNWGRVINPGTLAYPPHAIILLSPLRGLPFGLSFILWSALGALSLGLAAWVTFGHSWRASLFVLLTPAAFFSLWIGQSGLFASAFFIAGLGLLQRRPVLAGVFIGLLTFKPTYGLLIPFALLAGGHWRAIFSASLTAGGLILASMWLYGTEVWGQFFASIPAFQMSHQTPNEELIVNLIPTIFMAARLLGFDSAISYAIQGIAGLIVITVITWAFYSQRDFGLKCGLLFVGTTLIGPHILTYDLSFVTVAIYLLLQDFTEHEPRIGERSIAVLVWLLPVIVYFFNSIGALPIGPLLHGLLFAVLLRRLAKD